MNATKEGENGDPQIIAEATIQELMKKYIKNNNYIPNVEDIQDIVEKQLILHDFVKTAKAYILYRQEHKRLREETKEAPEELKALVIDSKKYFRNSLSEFVYYRTYSKWIEEENRRETWIETIDRYIDFMREYVGDKFSEEDYKEVQEAILKQEIMPSMRLMWSAGKAARNSNVTAYNCSYVAPTKIRDFGEIMYILMCGAGVGFSVEARTINQLPEIKKQTGEVLPTYIIPDSKEGWADSLIVGMEAWFNGKDIELDYSQLRPKGTRLRTMGGRSSGPAPLKEVHEFTRKRILRNQGKKMSPIDIHDLICKIGEVVVVGGVRRSALISLSDLDDRNMREAKTGQFYLKEPQRAMANNSAVYNKKPSQTEFLEEWLALMTSGSGERGIFNRGGLEKQVPERRWGLLKDYSHTTGTNPCGEITLRSRQFCNLTEVIARKEDTEKSLMKKVRLATILGTYQGSLTDFNYLSNEWRENCEEERLLGVSITGQWDSLVVRNTDILNKLREESIRVNKKYSEKLGINPSTSITCVKPSGNVSQLTDTSSGMHPRHSKFYIRRVRISANDSLFRMLRDQGVPFNPEVGQNEETASTFVLDFPVKSPEGAILKNDLTAIQQLEHWKMVKENFTEHNPSVTISIGDNEWINVAKWLYDNWDILGGLSFLPRSNHVYELAPYEEIDEETYEKMIKEFENMDFSKIIYYEKEDETIGSKELACIGNGCELDFIPSHNH